VRRVSVGRLGVLADGMPLRERQIVETVARLSLVSGGQLSQLFFYSISNPSTRARRARRILDRLVGQRVLDHLERRRGGVGGGSSSWVYALGPVGRRLIAYWAGEGLPRSRAAYEPGPIFTAHRLAVSELYVQLRQAERAGRLELVAFDGEPAAWRRYSRLGGVTAVLKPDAYVQLGSSEWIDSLFVEVDLGSEHRGQLLRQHRAYGEHFRAGVEQAATGVYPEVLWLVSDARRAALLADIQRGLPEAVRRLFKVAPRERALAALCGEPTDGWTPGGSA
jgi:Replication-relaxation